MRYGLCFDKLKCLDCDGFVADLLTALLDQFTQLRDGDSLFYAGDTDLQTPEILALLGSAKMVPFEQLTMMDIVSWNTSFRDMPASFFMAIPKPASWVLLGLGSLFVLLVGRGRLRR